METLAANKALIRRWFEEVWNQKREATVHELIAPDAIVYGLSPDKSGPPPRGPEPFLAFWRQFCGAFPDIHITVEDVIAERDLTCARISFTGTHRGPHLGVAPTANRVSATGLCLTRWRDGQITEAWNEFDALNVMLQTNAVRPS
jgi:SnoaL-like polyketide cyclase